MEHTDPDAGHVDHIGLMCPNCKPIVIFNPAHRQKIVEHISAHVLHDPLVDRLSEPCGLCLRPAPLCKIVLKRAKGKTGKLAIDMEESSCANLVKLSIAIAAGYSDGSPCTNHPIICQHCDGSEASPVVWSYNFRSHLLREHPRISLEDHNDILILTKLEREGMKRIWDDRFKQRKARRKSQFPPLVISETYRSCLVFKYVFLFYLSPTPATQLMHKLNSSDGVPDLDASDEDTSSNSCSDHGEDVAASVAAVAELDGQGDITLVQVVTEADKGEDSEVQDLEYTSE